MPMNPEQLVQKLSTALVDAGCRVCTAESCTGGLIAKTCTDLAGSSDWFERGFVTYSNAAKSEMLAVPPTVIEDYGAVSEPAMPTMRSRLPVLPAPAAAARKSRWARYGLR
jgi:nicotinamide-nucleotide amidase